MVKTKIQRASQKGKSWQIKGTNPKTGKPFTIAGGQKGVKTGPKARGNKTANAFDKRHGAITSAKKYVNKRLRDNAKIGDTINIPNKYF